jgi:hypothetical protein
MRHEMRNVANFVAGVIDGLKKPATTGGGDGGGGLKTQNLVTDVPECTHTINGELRARRRFLALGVNNRYVGARWTGEADTSKLGASYERRVREKSVDEGSSTHSGGEGGGEYAASIAIRVEVARRGEGSRELVCSTTDAAEPVSRCERSRCRRRNFRCQGHVDRGRGGHSGCRCLGVNGGRG